MSDDIDEVLDLLREHNEPVPVPLELPDEDRLVEIEEELLLSLPAVAYHEEPCIDSKLYSSGKPVEVKKERNPFQVLEQLKSSPKS